MSARRHFVTFLVQSGQRLAQAATPAGGRRRRRRLDIWDRSSRGTCGDRCRDRCGPDACVCVGGVLRDTRVCAPHGSRQQVPQVPQVPRRSWSL